MTEQRILLQIKENRKEQESDMIPLLLFFWKNGS
jgi:hypothetical protein